MAGSHQEKNASSWVRSQTKTFEVHMHSGCSAGDEARPKALRMQILFSMCVITESFLGICQKVFEESMITLTNRYKQGVLTMALNQQVSMPLISAPRSFTVTVARKACQTVASHASQPTRLM